MPKNRIKFSDNFVLDNDKIGINTSSPQALLDVNGDVKVSGIVTSQSLNVTGNANFGRIGVGTDPSSSALDIIGNGKFTGIVTASQFSTGSIGNAINIHNSSITGPGEILIDPAPVGTNSGAVRVKGDLYIDGTTTSLNSVEIKDFKVSVASSVSSDFILDGAGIGIGSTNIRKTFVWEYATSSLKSSENINLGIGKTYKINGVDVLSSTTLGSGVVNSSLTSVGTLNQLSVAGVVTASSFAGVGSSITALNASNLTSGIVPAARITASGGDFAVGSNLFVNGTLSVGGTSVILSAATLVVKDKDIVVGYATDINGNDISSDNTANHGGISVASTVGSPIINIPLQVGVNSTPSTYKQFMWIKQGNYSGMGTDAWVSNYAISIGNTASVQNGSRLTVGAGFTVYDTYLDASSIDIYGKVVNAKGVSVQGNVTPTANNTYDLGSNSLRWNNVYVNQISASTITGTLSGAASSLTITPDNQNTSRYFVLSSATSGITSALVDADIVFNPSTVRLGIGTTNPTTTVDIRGVLGFGAGGANNIRIGDNNTGSSITSGVNNFFAGAGAGLANTSGSYNNFLGRCAGCSNTSGIGNNFIGGYAGFKNTTASGNNFFGGDAGRYNTTGCNNNFFGVESGRANTTGSFNNFFGNRTGFANTTGSHNTFIGFYAGRNNTSANDNIFIGCRAGCTNTTGTSNNFLGNQAGFCNTTGSNNNFFGYYAGFCNTTGGHNNFFGCGAGRLNTTGSNNTFIGNQAGFANTTGSDNNFLGSNAGSSNSIGCNNNFFGFRSGLSNTVGSFNNFLGFYSGYANTTGSCNNFFGRCAGFTNTTGSANNFFGGFAGRNNTTGSSNNFFGTQSGQSNTTGGDNNFLGFDAGSLNTTGNCNNFLGRRSGYKNTTGSDNNFFGFYSGACNTTGSNNNFLGNQAGFANTSGSCNTFIGFCAGLSNTSGNYNNFLGLQAGYNNTIGSHNNFFGTNVGLGNTTGAYNNFLGFDAGRYNTTGSFNSFFGRYTGRVNTTGSNNNFLGQEAGRLNTTGSCNNFIGYRSGFFNTTGTNNNFFGDNAGNSTTTGSFNTFLGRYAGINNTTGSHNVAIGNNAQLPSATGSCQLTIASGNTAWIYGTSNGNVGIGTTIPTYKLHVVGDFGATTKSFVIPHPTKPGLTLRHGSLEGAENGVYVRGKTTESIIPLPDYWTGLVDEESITVNLTAKNDYHHRVVGISSNQVEIKAVGGEIDCYFMILGERKDVAKLVAEY